ncbi:hypothetical protein D9M73_244710 [compost metagenome]
MQLGDFLVTVGAEGFHGAVQVQAVAGLVLDLRHQLQLALEAGGTGNPVAFGQHADDFRVGVLGDLPDEGLAVGLGHPVLGFDLDFGVDLFLEVAFLGGHFFQRLDALDSGFH